MVLPVDQGKGLPREDGRKVVTAFGYLAVFFGLVLLLFLTSDRRTVIYDEGILLTGAMQVLAGQVIHRDFYYNYGPATIYMTAGLFKFFGSSVLVERLLGLSGDALLVITMYAIGRRLTRRKVALAAAAISLLWVIGIGNMWSLLTAILLWATWFVARSFQCDLLPSGAFVAGTLVGVATLFRYDVGLATLICHLLIVIIAVGLRAEGVRSWAASVARNLWPYLLATAAVLVAPVWAYLRVAPAHDVLFDILYTAHHYRQSRGLPFPRPRNASFQDMVVYVLILVILASLYVAVRSLLHTRRSASAIGALPARVGALIAFGMVATMTLVKGMVRITAEHEGTTAMACVLMVAVLYEHKSQSGVGANLVVVVTSALFFLTTVFGILLQISSERKHRTSMLMWLIAPEKMAPRPPFNGWCRDETAVAREVCYVMDDDHIQTVEFLESHTRPGDTLYVGLPEHDRVYINDNLTYFAAQRLPATKWSHFDPFLQNSSPTQREMIEDLERNRPPYIVLDSEFDAVHEQNGSSLHTGVHLLDDYIRRRYQTVARFGEMTVLERQPEASATQAAGSVSPMAEKSLRTY